MEEEDVIATEEDVMVGVDALNSHTADKKKTFFHGFPDNTTHVSKFEKRRVKAFAEEFEEYLRLKREKFNNQGQSSSAPSASTSCTVEGQGPWILDSGAFDHIFYSRSSFSLISSPKIPHHVTITNGFKVASQAIVQVSLSPFKS